MIPAEHAVLASLAIKLWSIERKSHCSLSYNGLGVEGLNLEDDRHLELANTELDVARAILRLLADPERRHALGRARRTVVEEDHR